MKNVIPSGKHSRSVMMAVVLGTALTTARATENRPEESTVKEIERYCQTCWKNARLPVDHWPDCTQQVFTRLLERVDRKSWKNLIRSEGEDKREFLRAIDAVKKRTQRRKKFVELQATQPDFRSQFKDSEINEQKDMLRQASSRVLSSRQQRIIELTSKGWSVHEIALELELSPQRVSDEKYKAIQKLRGLIQSSL